MMPTWLQSLCRRLRATAPVARPRPSPNEPYLEFVGTRDLFTAIASRYDACVIVCVRHTERKDGSCSAVLLAQGVEQPAGFLRSAATLVDDSKVRDLQEGDL